MPPQYPTATAMITGGRRGIGFAIAKRLAAAGHAIAIAIAIAITGSGGSDAPTRAAVAELEEYGVPVRYFKSDIAAPADHAAVLDSIEQQLGPIAVLVANAGIAPPERLDVLDTTAANFDAVLNTNLRGAFFLAQAVAKRMLTRSAVRLCGIATLGWNWTFCAPLLPGDRIYAEITVVSKRATKRADRGIVTFGLRMINQHQAIVQQGETLLMMRH